VTRYIIQIAATRDGRTNYETLYALANDGTAWVVQMAPGHYFDGWELVPTLPQPPAEETP